LLALVARAPDEAREALLDLQRRGTEPIPVEEIRIEPLRSDYANDDTK
jgi:uroporphyrinogen-III synthase